MRSIFWGIYGVAFFALVLVLSVKFFQKYHTPAPVPVYHFTTITKTINFADTFNHNGYLEESGHINQSANNYWWLNSGGQLSYSNGVVSTLQGDLSPVSPWRLTYALSNPTDTDSGLHPQNIFRLVNRQQWQNYSQQVYFRVKKINFSSSPNRNASNGVFFFNHYLDGDNLYYTGLRVDGTAVVKRKFKGSYSTLGSRPVFNLSKYDPVNNPDLLPLNTWIGLKTEVQTQSDKSVLLTVLIDPQSNGQWTKILSVVDNTTKNGSQILAAAGFTGLRTDFMDVEFKDYQIVETQ